MFRSCCVLLALSIAACLAGCGATTANSGTGKGGGDTATTENAQPDAPPGPAKLRVDPPESPWIHSAAWESDGEGLVFATADGRLHRLDTASGETSTLTTIEDVNHIAIIPGGYYVLVLGESAPPRIVSADKGTELLRFHDWSADISAASHNGELLLIARDNKLGVWDLPNQAVMKKAGERVQDFVNRQRAEQQLTLESAVTAIDVLDDQRFAVSFDKTDGNGNIYVWNKSDPKSLDFLGRTNGTIVQLHMSGNGKWLAALNQDGNVFVTATGKQGFLPWASDLHAESVDWTDSGLLIVHDSGQSKAINAASGQLAWSRDTGSLSSCWANGDRLVCTDGKELILLDGRNGERVATSAAFDGKHLTFLESGLHVGDGEADWLGIEKSHFDDKTDAQAIASALASWGR